jgi:hypothetical protein
VVQEDSGKLHYFGKLDKPQAALELWADQKDDLFAWREPRIRREGLTVKKFNRPLFV